MSYFNAEAFKFFRDLARHNERAWFHANQARYEAAVRDPFLHLITDLAEPLAKISPHFRADPKPVSEYCPAVGPTPPVVADTLGDPTPFT